MGTLAPTGPAWPRDAYTTQQIQEKLELWTENLRELNAGTANTVLTRADVMRAFDRWLDEKLDMRGR